ncbi:MAG: ABC transporter ATP-binding protein, partial [Planctomycetes bacterium]|nr:ABC transporter ATP-binding protein [Planctomycetota bacterium]
MSHSSLLPLLDQEYQSKHPFSTLKRLLRIPNWQAPLYLLLYVIKSSPTLLLPLYLEQMVRYAKDPAALSEWWFWAANIGYLFILLQNIPTHLLFVKMVHKHIRGMEHRLRASLVARLQQLSIRFHTESESGRLQAKVLRDVELVVQMTISLFHSGFSTLTTITWGLAVTFYTDSTIGMFFILGAPVAAVLIYGFRKRMRQHNHEYRNTLENMNARMSEMIDSIPVTRAHAEEEREITRAKDTLNHVYHAGMQIDRTNHFFAAASFVSMQISIITVVAVTTWLVATNVIPLERIMLYYGLFGLVVNSLVQMLGFAPIISNGFEAMRSIGEVLECPDL